MVLCMLKPYQTQNSKLPYINLTIVSQAVEFILLYTFDLQGGVTVYEKVF